MKRVLTTLLAAIGAIFPSQSASSVETVDVKSILYSMPTIAADSIAFVVPTSGDSHLAPVFHEDQWAQLEFFPKSRLSEIQEILKQLNAFEKINRSKSGWKHIFARKISRSLVLPVDNSLKEFGTSLPAPILVTSSRPLGQVKDGFSVRIGVNAHLYGLADGAGISVLAAHLAGADDMLLTRAFTTLNKRHGLIFVDWRQQLLLVSVAPTGDIEFWRP